MRRETCLEEEATFTNSHKGVLRLGQPLGHCCSGMNRLSRPLPQGLGTGYFSLLSGILILSFIQVSAQMSPQRGLLCSLPSLYNSAFSHFFPFLPYSVFLHSIYYHLAWYVYLFICGFHLQELGSVKAAICLLLFTVVQIEHLEVIFGTNQALTKSFLTNEIMCLSMKSLSCLLRVKS